MGSQKELQIHCLEQPLRASEISKPPEICFHHVDEATSPLKRRVMSFYPLGIEHFDSKTFLNSCKILREIWYFFTQMSKPTYEKCGIAKNVFLKTLGVELYPIFDIPVGTPPCLGVLESLKKTASLDSSKKEDNTIESKLRKLAQEEGENRIILTSSHHSSDLLMLDRVAPWDRRELLLIVFDNHFDAGGLPCNGASSGSCDGKHIVFFDDGSWLRVALKDMGVGGLVIIGASDDSIEKITGQTNDRQDGDYQSKLHQEYLEFLKAYKDRILIIPRNLSLEEIKNYLIWFLRSRFYRSAVFSIDLDVVNSFENRITAIQYSHYALLGYLGLRDFNRRLTQAWDKFLKGNSKLSNFLKDFSDLFGDPGNYRDGLTFKLDGYDFLFLPPLICGKSFMHPSGLIRAIKTIRETLRNKGISLGVPLVDNRLYLGHICELTGYDYGGRTLDLALDVARAIGCNNT